MSTGNAPKDDVGLDEFLARQSPLSADYAGLETVEPPATLDAKILAAAKAAARPAAKPAAAAMPAAARSVPKPAGQADGKPAIAPARRPAPVVDDDDDDDDDDAPPPSRRPRWLLPAALAASLLVAVGIGLAVFDMPPSVKEEGSSGLGSLFAKRARERSVAEKAAAEAAAEEAEVAVMAVPPPPPPPFFEFDGPQVADLDAAIALIRRELLQAGQQAALEEVPLAVTALSSPAPVAAEQAPPTADSAVADTAAEPASPAGVIQPRDRRLAKILELYDSGNPYLAEDALEIFLRDFADDPISQRILAIKPP